VALNAKTHRVTYNTLSRCHVGDVAMTGAALYFIVANVRRVIETHVRYRGESIHSLPRNILAAVVIVRNLLQLRLVLRHVLVAIPTFIYRWDFRYRSFLYTFMTIGTHHFHFQNVDRVGVLHRLNRLGTDVEKLPDR
jgi:hypothetical protein